STARTLVAPTVVTGSTSNTWSTSYTVVSGDNNGVATVSVSVTDTSGNAPTPATGTLAIDQTPAVAGGITANVTNVDTVHNSVTFSAISSKRLQSATVSSTNSDTGTCTCDGGACNATSSPTPLVACTITVTHA